MFVGQLQQDVVGVGPYATRSTLYDDIHSKGDIIVLFREGLERAGYRIDQSTQKITCTFTIPWEYDWHHVLVPQDIDCHLWHRVMFDLMGRRWVPTGCQSCYKIVIKPQTLEQLFATLDLQLRLNLPAKCGIETRRFVYGSYGGYWYCRGLEQGLERYRQIRAAVRADPLLKDLLQVVDNDGVPTHLILKRGCTEYEHALGPSDQWGSSPEQQELEARIAAVFERQPPKQCQPQYVLDHIHSRWIEFAWDRGDPTVYKFLSRPLYPPYVVYHHLAEREG